MSSRSYLTRIVDGEKVIGNALTIGGNPLEWFKVNDTVMGGRSTSSLHATVHGYLHFSGTINTIGGGFASCAAGRQTGFNLPVLSTAVRVTATTDGQLYKLVLRTTSLKSAMEPSWQCDFPKTTTGASGSGVAHTFKLRLANFVPSRFGQPVSTPRQLYANEVVSVGLSLSLLDMNGKPNPNFGVNGKRDEAIQEWPFNVVLSALDFVEDG